MNRNRTGFLDTRTWQSRPKRAANACLRYLLPELKIKLKRMVGGYCRDSSCITGGAGLNYETGFPEMCTEVEEALGLVFKL